MGGWCEINAQDVQCQEVCDNNEPHQQRESGVQSAKNPKCLWRVLNTTMRLSQPETDIPHSADDFTHFFADKVSRIRGFTAPPPSYSSVWPLCSLSSFELVTV